MGTRALVTFTCLSLGWMVDGFVLHVSEDAQPGTTISGLRRRASCALDQILLPRSADGFLRSESGALALFSRPDCRALRSNPLSVFTLEDCAGNASDFRHLISSRYDLHVHGRNCAIRRTRRRETRDVEIISLRKLTECRAAGSALLRLSDVIPGHLPRCSVSGTSALRYTRGRLFTSAPLCFTRDSLLEFHLRCVGRDGGVVRVHWRAGSGAFTQTHLKELLERAASSDSGLLNRRKRGINNNPQFLPPMYQVSVAENQPAGTFVVLLKASDPDEGEAGRLEYSLEALFDSRSDNLFSADPASGVVTTLDILDRETKDTHVFRVTAVDHGSPRRTAMATLTVTVSDTNDHEPVFEHQNYRESVRENLEIGYEVLTVRATDGDAPVNGNILYHLTTSNQSKEAFEIDSRSGVIRTRGLVDRETADAYVLLVEANDQGRDPGARSATATVYITVEDDNDNAPQFSEKRYVVQVPEDRPPNTEILQVTASDQDRGNNAMVHFSIMSGNTRGQFYIDAQTGKLDLVSQLDYEMNKEYTLRIRAQDGGRPPLSNISGLVTVQVLDVNDNAPIFVSTPFQATVLENVPIGYSVIHIQAVDADAGDNSRLQYHLTETTPNFPFTVNNSTGWIVVASQLDRETLDFYTFGVEARDHGSPPMSSSASISMTILDVNDNNPEFTQQAYYMRLNEDAAVGMSVVTVSALDQDINSVVTYQITTGNTRNRFSITSQSGGGLISLALPLDYKLERQFVLTVMASDGTRFDTAKVYVNVTDANTHRPVFQSSHYTVNINEDRAVGTTVVLISATDEDTGENARITYLMDDSIPQFSIDPDNGAVTTQMELDYEDHVSYTLAITARDNGIPQKSDTTYLEILINDVNDNSPLFLRDRYQGSVTEDIPVYTSVLQVSATDRDSGLNGRVFYTFQGGEDGDGDFIIESTSGIVRTLQRLDRENTPLYNLQAFAVDKGVPALKRPVEIQVTVLDVNDNPPVFEKDEFDIFVEENVPIGLVVAHISASDPDEGTNAQVMYQIVEGNIPEIFQLDIFTGELTALTDLDYESRPEYVIVVQATSAPLVSRATVHIKVLDKNDNPPVLKDFQIIFNNYVTDKTNSFPDGVIGRIPAYDPDVSDQLHYTFESGNELNLVILNRSSGEIRLSRALDNNRPLEAPMKISVSDGRHSVCSQCVLQVRVITDELLSNSITLRLLNTSEENFLSEVLSRFLEGVARVLSVGLDDVLLFNVREDTDVSSGVLNVSLTVSGTLEPEELQERLYLKRGLLTHVSAQNVLPFDDNICLREPCENYMKCVSVLRFDSLAPFVASNSVLFRPIRPITGLRCRCPRGFTGDFCETEIDLCYSKPCGAHGVCLTREGGFTCRCLHDYTGERCEVSSRSGRCVEGVCKNGGTCVNLLVGGFRCECPSGAFEKPFCVMSSRNFPPGSFITFRGLRQRFHFTITLTFVTQDSDALLLYNGRFNQKHDFIALEIVEQQLQLSFSAGETRTTVGVYLKGGVSDGQWHTAHIHYYNKASLSRGGVPQGPSDQKIAVLTVDECDSAMSLHFGRAINYSCSAQSSQSGTKKSLDLTGPLLLGGVPRLPDEFPVRSRRFSGCMKDLHVDGRAIDMASFIANNGTLAGCSVKQHFCSTQPCVNGGRCRDLWGSYSCECPLGTGGQHCQTIMPNPLRFQGNGVLSWNDVAAVVTLPWHLEFMFRTRQATSTILHINTVQQHNITVQLRGGRVLMSLQRGEDAALSRVDDVTLDDGQWHHVLLDLRGAAGVVTATLTLDHGLYTVWMELDWRLSGVRMKSVSVGGVSSDGKVMFNGFIGCVQGLRMGEWFPSMHQSVGVNVETGCRVPDPCASSPCPRHSRCTDLWDAHTCSCLPGHYGNNCTHACDLNPCLHQSTCSRASGSTHGYACSCTAGFSGQYCERRADLPCPRGWWGEKSCGPCNCDTSKGFDSDCNKTSGTCRCKDNHYLAPGAEMCVLCDCYHMGSFSRVCDRSSGQCQCKPGVIGRQCDRCDNPFAEVSTSGCEVIYDSCPQVMEGGIWWPRTRFGLPVVVSCPKGSIGAAIRHCDEHRGWMSPDLFNCSGSAFTNLSRLVGRVEREGAQRAIEQLYNVTTVAREFYGSDVRLAYQLMRLVLQHESRQHGFNLTATQHVLFNQHLMQVGSALLAVGNRAHWQHIQQTEAGSAELMWWMEQYINNLAQNMRKTYLSPFIIITPNIVVSVERLEKAGFSGATLPRYKSVRGWRPGNHDTSVTLPDSVFIPRPEVRGQHGELTGARGNLTVGRRRREEEPEEEPEAIASIIIYYSLPGLLPHSYDPDKRSLRVPKRPVINTPVVSISLHAHQMQDILHDPITVQFRLMTSHERSKPTCVHWNHSILAAGVGGWSSKGCEMVFRNRTHISCQCYHMTSFAVLMDVSHRENGEVLPVRLLTWSCVCVTLGFLALTVLFLSCVPAARSNHANITKHSAIALFTAHLLFILGINQADSPFVCSVMAILQHFFWLCVFSWMFLEALHTYRRLLEPRDLDHGAMHFYFLLGWGIPAVITGLAVGLDPEGYGNPDFCSLSLYDTLVWSLAGPVALVLTVSFSLYFLSLKASVSIAQRSCEKRTTAAACALLLLVTVTCVLSLLSVNFDLVLLHQLFAAACCLQGPCVFLLRVAFNRNVRDVLRHCCSGKRSNHLIKTKPSAFVCSDTHLYHLPLGESSASLNVTQKYSLSLRDDVSGSKTNPNEHETLFQDKEKIHDSDSDTDLSEGDHSGSFSSTHSSDSEGDEGEIPQEECWENLVTSSNHQEQSVVTWPVEAEESVNQPETQETENLLLLLPSTQLQRGILKKPLSPISERNTINRFHKPPPISPTGSASSRVTRHQLTEPDSSQSE